MLNAVLVDVLGSLYALVHDEDIARHFEDARDDLRRCVFEIVKSSTSRLTWRAEWLTYVALKWTGDDVHVDWLLQKLGDSRYIALLQDAST